MFYWWMYAVKSLTPIKIMWYESTDVPQDQLTSCALLSDQYCDALAPEMKYTNVIVQFLSKP